MRMPKVGDVIVCKYLNITHPNAPWMCSFIGTRDFRSADFPPTFSAEDSGIYKNYIFEFRRFVKSKKGEFPIEESRKIFGYEVEGMIALDAMRIVDISSYIFE